MNLFKRKKQKELSPLLVKPLTWINLKLLRWSNYLQKKTDQYSKNRKKFFLVLFCLVFVIESTVVMVSSFQSDNVVFYTIAPIKMVPLANDPRIHPGFTKDEHKRIEQFRLYLDSNVLFRDSLLTARPHFLDTLNYLQKIYKQYENGK